MNKNIYESPELKFSEIKSEEVLVASSSVLDQNGNIELPFVPANKG